MSAHEEFLAGERPDDVLVYLADETLGDRDALSTVGERAADGVVIVAPGEDGRRALRGAVGLDPMVFAREAMEVDGAIDRGCTTGACPADGGGDHDVRFVFAFAEAENPDAGGLYAEGDVIHAYARCACGRAYSDRWVAGEG